MRKLFFSYTLLTKVLSVLIYSFVVSPCMLFKANSQYSLKFLLTPFFQTEEYCTLMEKSLSKALYYIDISGMIRIKRHLHGRVNSGNFGHQVN